MVVYRNLPTESSSKLWRKEVIKSVNDEGLGNEEPLKGQQFFFDFLELPLMISNGHGWKTEHLQPSRGLLYYVKRSMEFWNISIGYMESYDDNEAD